ncbi:hypothetical protein MTO96_018901 [Rhipicephalus appendiculatus]
MSQAWEFNCPKYFDFELGDETHDPPPDEYFESHKDSPTSPLPRRKALRALNVTQAKPVKPATTTFKNGYGNKVRAPATKPLENAACKGDPSKPATTVHNVPNRTAPSKAQPTMAEFIHNYFFKTPARLRSKMTTAKPRYRMRTTIPISPKLRTMLRAKQRSAAKKKTAV